MKKNVAILLSFILLALVGIFIYAQQTKLSDEDIRKQFYCDRATDDYRRTDVYCTNPELYRQHEREGKIIGDE